MKLRSEGCEAGGRCKAPPVMHPVFSRSQTDYGIDFVHRENDFVDFDRDKLIFHMLSTEGPRMARGDVNGDGLEDVYVCGAKDQAGGVVCTAAGRKV